MQETSKAWDILKQHGIVPTWQRLAVLDELLGRRDHPGAEDLWATLKTLEPPISKATVYNVLRLFSDKGIVKPIYIQADTLRYDIEQHEHGHFQCEGCNRIYNFPAVMQEAPTDLSGFAVKLKDVYFRGLCPQCQGDKAAQAAVHTNKNEEDNQ